MTETPQPRPEEVPDEAVRNVPAEEAPDQPPPAAREQPITQPGPDTSILEQQAAQEIKRIEKDIRRDMSDDEKQVIFAKYFGERVSAIDRKTNELYNGYEHITKSTKLKRFLSGLGQAVGTGLAGWGLRSGLKAVLPKVLPGFAPFVGTITGGVLGGVLGGWRGRKAEQARQFGIGWQQEYERIKNPTAEDPETKKKALAFLETVLSSGEFKGNHGELLGLLAFYRKEATGLIRQEQENAPAGEDRVTRILSLGRERIEVDDNVVLGFLSNLGGQYGQLASQLIEGYKKDPAVKTAIRNATIKGVFKGAAIGAGLGLVSDIIASHFAHIRAEHAGRQAHEQFMGQHAGRAHEYNLQNWDAPPTAHDVIATPDLATHNLNIPTDYGNALAHAMRVGVEQGKLQLPKQLAESLSPDQQTALINRIIHSFNFAQPLPEHANVPIGQYYNFNEDGVGWLFNNALRGVDPNNLAVMPDNFYKLVTGADDLLTKTFQPMLEQAATQTGIRAAAQAAAERGLETAAHGFAIGAGTVLATDKMSKRKSEQIATGETSQPDQAPGQATPQIQAPPAEPAVATPVNEPDTIIPPAEQQEEVIRFDRAWNELENGKGRALSRVLERLNRQMDEKRGTYMIERVGGTMLFSGDSGEVLTIRSIDRGKRLITVLVGGMNEEKVIKMNGMTGIESIKYTPEAT